MMNKVKKLFFVGAISFSLITIPACKLSEFESKNDKETNENNNQKIQGATDKEDKWEYLVVTFGKTSFVDIEESIKNGRSKLAAFNEFASFLSGYEGIDLQAKLDILGRFGWGLVDTVGEIGGDQQLIFKRQRLDQRIEIEQDAIKKLSEILKQEGEKKELRLKELMLEIEKKRTDNEKKEKNESLIEFDSFEKRQREQHAENSAKTTIEKMFPLVAFVNKTNVKTVKVDVSASENEHGALLYSGNIEIIVDATEALIFDGNKYRKSTAKGIHQQFVRSIFEKTSIRPGNTLSDFKIKISLQVTHNGNTQPVFGDSYSDSVNVVIPNYKGRWESM
jgi:hypothetical protein